MSDLDKPEPIRRNPTECGECGTKFIEEDGCRYSLEQLRIRDLVSDRRELKQQAAMAQVSDEAAADFLRLAKFSDGWNSYNFEQFKEFRQREIDREAALALRSKE